MVEIRAHSLRELNPSGKFVADVFKPISRRNVFQERFTWKAVVVGLFLAQFLQYGRSSQGNIFQTATPQGKPFSILSSKLQYCVSHKVFFCVKVSYIYVYFQTSLRFVNIFSIKFSMVHIAALL